MSRQADAPAALGWSPATIAIPAGALRRAFAVAAILMAANAFYGFFTGAPPEVEPGEIVEVSARGSRAYVALWLASSCCARRGGAASRSASSP